MNLLKGLNDKQQEAVQALDGVIKVVAGAGSGKTRALTHRYAFLVDEVGINPENILCLTFTNKASNEMRTRIQKLVSIGHFNDFITTIHGFCVKVLRKEIYRIGYPKTFQILDEEDRKTIAKQILEEMGISREQRTVKQILKGISFAKACNPYIAMFLLPEKFKEQNYAEYSLNFDSEIKMDNEDDLTLDDNIDFNEIFKRFLYKQLKSYSLDFSDLIYFTLYIWNNHEDCLKNWQRQFDYVMVDEVQDLNDNDWEIITLMSKRGNLFVVGDPDQAIYEWRGATPDTFVKMSCDEQIIMDENYRSTENILNVANSVIRHNKNRIEKNLFTRIGKADNVIHYHGKNEKEEAQWIAKQIADGLKNGRKPSDYVVLVRAIYLTRSIEQEFVRNKIPYTIWGGVRFFERREIKDALSYLRLLDKPDDVSFLRVYNVPSRKLGEVFINKLSLKAEKEHSSLYDTLLNYFGCTRVSPCDKDLDRPTARAFIDLIESLKQKVDTMSISDLLQEVMKKSGLEELLRTDDDEERLENINELMESIRDYERENTEEEVTLSSYLQDIALLTNVDYMKDSDKVRLMTIHQSKGLEFPFVFISGLTEGVFPNYRSIRERREKALEEERRLFYVACTRAEKVLFLTESEGFQHSINSIKYPSRFLREIEKEYIITQGNMEECLWEGTRLLANELEQELDMSENEKEFKVGDRIVHRFYGLGTIKSYKKRSNVYECQFDKDKAEEGYYRRILPKFLFLASEESEAFFEHERKRHEEIIKNIKNNKLKDE